MQRLKGQYQKSKRKIYMYTHPSNINVKKIGLRHPNIKAQQGGVLKNHQGIHKRQKIPHAPSHKKHK
jgi:hypothetical protein